MNFILHMKTKECDVYWCRDCDSYTPVKKGSPAPTYCELCMRMGK